jgi:hypothetical protein
LDSRRLKRLALLEYGDEKPNEFIPDENSDDAAS